MALDTLTGAPVPEPEDDTEVYEAGPLGVLQKQLAVTRASQLAERKKSWDNVAQALEKSRPSKSEMWFSLASALAQPTKTGSFGETLGNVSQTLGETRKAQREFDTSVAKNQFERDQDLAELGSKYDLKGYDLQAKALAGGKRKTAFNPVTGQLTFTDTGELVNPNAVIPEAKPVTIGGNEYVRTAKGGLDRVEPTIAAAAERAGAIDLAKESASARAMLPKARLNAENALKQVDQLLAHPGLSAVVGWPNPLKGGFGFAEVPNSDAAGFRARLDQLKGGAFLEAYTTLKGGGAIANAEGEKAQAAVARMSTAQSEAEFKEAMNDYKSAVQRGLDAMEQTAAMGGGSSSGSKSLTRPAPKSAPKGELPPLNSFYKK
jgi:hypothetical protein